MKRFKLATIGLFIGLLLTACSSMMQALKMDNKIKEIELGMSRKEVIHILGNNYEPIGASVTPHGSFERISYYVFSQSDNTDGHYILTFRDGKLVEWVKERNPIQQNQSSN